MGGYEPPGTFVEPLWSPDNTSFSPLYSTCGFEAQGLDALCVLGFLERDLWGLGLGFRNAKSTKTAHFAFSLGDVGCLIGRDQRGL